MNVTKCLTVTGLVLLVVVGVFLVSLFVLRKSKPGDKDDVPSKTQPSQDVDKKVKGVVDEQQKKLGETLDAMKSAVEEEKRKVAEELKKRDEETLRSFEEQFKPREPEVAPETPTVDLVLDLDLNLPASGSAQYNSGSNKMNVEREPIPPYSSGAYLRYKHQRPEGQFNISKVRFFGKEYAVPPSQNVRYLITFSLEHEPGFIYYIILVSKDLQFLKNDGSKFVESDDKTEFYPAMLEMAKEYGRQVPESAQLPQRPAAPTPEPAVPAPKASFELNLNAGKVLYSGADKIDYEEEKVFKRFLKRTHTNENNVPLTLKVGGNLQSGLPTDIALREVTVYCSQLRKEVPLVLVLKGERTETYLNAHNNNWVPYSQTLNDSNMEDFLNYMDSMVNNFVVLNVGRRTDYFRNGTENSNLEYSKDMNVYVEVDKPCAGYNTYRHMLEVKDASGQSVPVNFTVKKAIFANDDCRLLMKENVQYVDAYAKSDDTTKGPAVLFFQFSDGSTDYSTRAGSLYLDNNINTKKITPENLVQRLQEIDAPPKTVP